MAFERLLVVLATVDVIMVFGKLFEFEAVTCIPLVVPTNFVGSFVLARYVESR